MSELLQLQTKFSLLVAELIKSAGDMGYSVTLGEAWRSPETARAYAAEGKGISQSLHIDRLAIDLNLFRGDVLLTGVEDYRELGERWKSLDPLCCWGGDFEHRPDADHFSVTYQGRR